MKFQDCVFVLFLTALVWSATAAAGPYDQPPPNPTPPASSAAAPAPPENPEDPVHQCRLGCGDSCKAFANPGLRQQCLDSCYSKCTATYGP